MTGVRLGPRPSDQFRPRRGGGVATGIGALTVILAVVAGLPWALLQLTTWPVTGVPTWQQVRDLPTTLATDQAIMAVFVVGLWIAWLVFTTSVLSEAAGHVRGREVRRLPGAAPLQLAARNLVAAVVMAAGPLGPGPVSAARLAPEPAPALALPAPSPAPTTPTTTTPPAPPPVPEVDWQRVTVGDGDTAWGLAETHYGDGTAAHQLWLDNRNEPQHDGQHWADEGDPVEPGWVLRVRVQQPDPAQPHESATDAQTTTPAPPATVVEPGDNLWSISEDALASRTGHHPAPPETAPFWQDTVDLNRPHLRSGDPDLVYPGEHIRLPTTPPAPTTPAAPERTPAPTGPPPPPPPTPPAPPEPPTPPTATAPSAPASPATSTPQTSGSGSSDTTSNRPTSENENEDDRQVTAVGIAVSAGLAALTLTALARRRLARRRGIRPGTTTGPMTADDIATEQAVATAADDTWRTMRRTVDAISTVHRASPDSPVVVTAVVVHPDGDATVHLTEPAPPVAPFLADPADPDTWRLPAHASDEQPDDDNDQPVPVLETLVTLGQTTAGEWVFIDLESLGAVSIEGHPDRSARLARSLAAELALQPVDHYVDVTIAGQLDSPVVAEQGIVTADQLDDTLVRTHEQHAHDTARWIADEGFTTTTAARAHDLPRDGLAVAALVAGPDTDPVLVGRLAEAAAPGGRGLAVISLTPLDPPAAQLVVADDGTVEVLHLGLTVQAASLEPGDLQRIDDLLTNEPTTVTETAPEPEPASIPPAAASTYTEPKWDYCVRVFADTVVCTPDGEPVSFRYGENPVVTHKNTNRGPELLAYLALRPDRSATRDEVREHLWWGRSISTRSVDTLIGGTRKVLGGLDYLSAAQGNPGQRRYHLAPTVVTDVELLDHALAYARTTNNPDAAVTALRPALERIERPLFRQGHMGGGLAEWATAHRVTDIAEQAVVDAALLLVEALHPQGPDGYAEALHLVEQALQACEINEALIRAAMKLDAHRGYLEAAQARYQALATRLARDDLEPEAETTALRAEIMSPGYRIG